LKERKKRSHELGQQTYLEVEFQVLIGDSRGRGIGLAVGERGDKRGRVVKQIKKGETAARGKAVTILVKKKKATTREKIFREGRKEDELGMIRQYDWT